MVFERIYSWCETPPGVYKAVSCEGDLNAKHVILVLDEDYSYTGPGPSALVPLVEQTGGLPGWDPVERIFTTPVAGNYGITFTLGMPILSEGMNNIMIRKEPNVPPGSYQWTDSAFIPGNEFVFTVSASAFLDAGQPIGLRFQNSAEPVVVKQFGPFGMRSQAEIVLLQRSAT